MAAPKRVERPLSPHLQIYRPQITSLSSILTRITGNGLIVAGLLIVWWLVAAVSSPGAFACADWVVRSWLGFIILTGSMWALWFHLLAGVRHLLYDAGHLLGIKESERASQVLIVGSVVLALLTLVIFFMF